MSVLISSSYTNAYAIYLGNKFLGCDAFTIDRSPVFPIPVNTSKKYEWFFFTEEDSLRRALMGEMHGNYLPAQFSLELLDDKWSFIQWLSISDGLTKGLKQWAISNHERVSFPCLLKSKHSWVNSEKLPRGWVCRSSLELDGQLEQLINNGLKLEYFFLQEWLGEKNPRVVSVCGFHDSNDNSRNLVAIVERIASHSAGLSCSAAVQTIHDEWLLIEKTKKILNSLQFVGPYELEYLVVGSDTFVLELNPRFWMQHAIFLLRGNGLIKRYLGRETEEDKKNSQVDDVVWVDSIHLLISIARLNFSLLALVFKKYFEPGRHILLWPSIPMAMYVVTRMVYEKIRARFKNEINKLR